MSVQNYLPQSNWFNPTSTPISTTENTADNKQTSQLIGSELANDTVSLSNKAQKLNRIHEEFFAGGPISSDKIRELAVRMHEEGLLEAADVSRLTGEAPPENNSVSQSVSFLTDYINADPKQTDHKQLSQALSVLQQVDKTATPEKRALEKQSQEFIGQYRQSLQEAKVSNSTLKEFDKLVNVFDALAKARSVQDTAE